MNVGATLVHCADYAQDPNLKKLKQEGVIADCPDCSGVSLGTPFTYCPTCDDTGFVCTTPPAAMQLIAGE